MAQLKTGGFYVGANICALFYSFCSYCQGKGRLCLVLNILCLTSLVSVTVLTPRINISIINAVVSLSLVANNYNSLAVYGNIIQSENSLLTRTVVGVT